MGFGNDFLIFSIYPIITCMLQLIQQFYEIPRRVVGAVGAIMCVCLVAHLYDYVHSAPYVFTAEERNGAISEFNLADVEPNVLDQCLSYVGQKELKTGGSAARWCGCIVADAIRQMPESARLEPFVLLTTMSTIPKSDHQRFLLGKIVKLERDFPSIDWEQTFNQITVSFRRCAQNLKA